jgi:hypothetical protein
VSVLFFLLALPLPLLLGAVGTRPWTVAICPVTAVVLGFYATATEDANYDMHGFGRDLGIAAAVVGVAVWLAARTFRSWWKRRAEHRST